MLACSVSVLKKNLDVLQGAVVDEDGIRSSRQAELDPFPAPPGRVAHDPHGTSALRIPPVPNMAPPHPLLSLGLVGLGSIETAMSRDLAPPTPPKPGVSTSPALKPDAEEERSSSLAR
ncbi:hypothetical protein SLS62_007040 [Diatrype stigma]|uniref:Uncharacterized protein n=1 Tax=Diatrype stigma TaxID=117547 RepID=A0AAN9YR75_9PEZI